MDAAEQISKAQDFLERFYEAKILALNFEGKKDLELDFSLLLETQLELAKMLLDTPEETTSCFEVALDHFDVEAKKVAIRFINLPSDCRVSIAELRTKHLKKFVFVEGIVRQKSSIRPRCTSAKFECPSCGQVLNVIQTDKNFREPQKCNCGRKGKFKILSKELVDMQRLILEQSAEELSADAQAKTINVLLKNNLCAPLADTRTNPGSRLKIIGTLELLPVQTKSGAASVDFDFIFEANNVEYMKDLEDEEVSEAERKQFLQLSIQPDLHQTLVNSTVPSIRGNLETKEAILLQTVGGVHKEYDDGTQSRGIFHIFLIGDPAGGKCLHGDSKIILGSGEIITIKSFVDKYKPNEKINPLSIPSIGLDGRMTCKDAIRVWKRKENDKLLMIKMASGKELKLTRNHPLFTMDDCLIVAKPACYFAIGQKIATPRKININGSLQPIEKFIPTKYAYTSKNYFYPEIMTKEFARLLGYLCGDGYVEYTKSSGRISFTNTDEVLLNDFIFLSKVVFGANAIKRESHRGKRVTDSIFSSKAVLDYFKKNFKEIACRSKYKDVPLLIQKSPDNILREFIIALFDCEGHIDKDRCRIEFSSISKNLASNLQLLLLRFGVVSSLYEKEAYAANTIAKRKMKAYRLIISGEAITEYTNELGFNSEKKIKQLNNLIILKENFKSHHKTNTDSIPEINNILFNLRKDLGLLQREMGISRTGFAHFEQNDRIPSTTILKKIVRFLKEEGRYSIYLDLIEKIADADLFWDKIISIAEIDNDEEEVYDLEVEETHNYVANGIIVHNSVLCKGAIKLSSRARYVEASNASGAGLTATVVKDEFLGGWSLQAGALPLCNNDRCIVDELDKAPKEQIPMLNESMESLNVSINKAGIHATLHANTSVLAAANPKHGRFDLFTPILQQIDIPGPTLSRFDLLLPVKDIPEKKRDEDMIDFVLDKHMKHNKKKGDCKCGGNMKKEDYFFKCDNCNLKILSLSFLKKYLAFAKKYSPEISKDAANFLKKVYVEFRGGGNGSYSQNNTVSFTMRQGEGLIRLSEAAAKLRLSNIVEVQDCERAKALAVYSMKELGLDVDSGKIDIDKIMTGISASSRSKMLEIEKILMEIEVETGSRIVSIDELISRVRGQGIDDSEVEEYIEKKKRHGDWMEPRRGFIQRI